MTQEIPAVTIFSITNSLIGVMISSLQVAELFLDPVPQPADALGRQDGEDLDLALDDVDALPPTARSWRSGP